MTELEIRMKIEGDSLASPDELRLRHKFQEEVEAREIGKDLGGGSGFGEMDVSVEVADAAKSKLSELAEELGIQDITIREESN